MRAPGNPTNYQSSQSLIALTGVAGTTDFHRVRFSMYKKLSPTVYHQLWQNGVMFNVSEINHSKLVLYTDSGGNPRLFVDGIDVSSPNGTTTVSSTETMVLAVERYRAGEVAPAVFDQSRAALYEAWGDHVMGIGIEANQLTDRYLFDLHQTFNSKAIAAVTESIGKAPTDAINSFTISDLGNALTYAATTYFRRADQAGQVLDGLLRTTPLHNFVQHGVSSAKRGVQAQHIHSKLQVPVVLPTMFFSIGGAFVDSVSFDAGVWTGSSSDPNESQRMRNVLAAYTGSGQEHALWEEITNTAGMSTIRSLQLARNANPIINISTVTSDNWLSWKASNESYFSSGLIDRISNRFLSGASSIIIPDRPTPSGAWNGVGYVARYGSNDLFIVSQLNGMEHYGGYLIGGTTLAPSVTAPLPQQYIALDPVNVATGAVNEDIVDVNIPAIGLPLTFSRHYDSNLVGMPNSLLGRGWYHNYSDRLVVSGTNQAPCISATESATRLGMDRLKRT